MTFPHRSGSWRRLFCSCLVALLLITSARSGFAQTRASIPSAEQQKESAKLLEEIHMLSRLKTAPEKQDVVKKLMVSSRDKSLASDQRYGVLTAVIPLAKEIGDFESWLEAVNVLVAAFEVDANKEKTRLLIEFLEARKPGALLKPAAVEEALAIARVAARENRYADANSVLSASEGAVRRATGANLLNKLVAETREAIAAREKDWKAFQTASTKLGTNGDDPAANFTVGRWHLLQQADWKSALPFLAKVSLANWKAAAELEQTAPLDPLAQAAVGDAWWEIAQAEAGATKTALLVHAGEWYARAQPNLTSALKKQLVTKRLDEIAPLKGAAPVKPAGPVNPNPNPSVTQTPPPAKPGEWIDLLEWSEGVDWAPRGIDWNGYLDGPPTKKAITLKPIGDSRFPLPAIIDGDYDMEVEFTRHGGFEAIVTYFPIGDHTFRLEMGGPGGHVFIQQAGGKGHGDTQYLGIANNQPHRILIQVRRMNDQATFRIELDGKKDFMKWEGPQSDFLFVPSQTIWHTTMMRHPWVGSWNNHVSFHKLRVHMVTGSIRRDTISDSNREQDLKNGLVRLVGEKAIQPKVGFGSFVVNQIPHQFGPGSVDFGWPLIARDFRVCDDFYGAHAPSRLKCPIPAGAKSFSVVGYNGGNRQSKFSLFVDGKKAFDSGVKGIDVIKIELPAKASLLELVAEPATAGNEGVHTYWCYPRFHSVATDKITDKMFDGKPGTLKFTIASHKVGAQTLTHNEPINTLKSVPIHFRDAVPCDEFLDAHAPSTVTYQVPEGMTRFTAIGYNVLSHSTKFEVWADTKRIYESPQAGIIPIDVKLPPGTKTIELKVNDLGDSRLDDSRWCYPRLHRK